MRSPLLLIFGCALVAGGLTEAADRSEYSFAASPGTQLVLNEYSPAAVRQKLRALTKPANPETLSAVAKCTLHPSAEVRLEAVQALARVGVEEEARRPLIAALADVDPAVQRESAKALGLLKCNAARPQLIAISNMTKDEALRRESLLAITAISVE